MIESPCKRHCCLDHEDVCLGCHRSLDEIRQWGRLDSNAKQTILDNARQRKGMQQSMTTQPPLK